MEGWWPPGIEKNNIDYFLFFFKIVKEKNMIVIKIFFLIY